MAACRMLGKAGYEVDVAASAHPAPAQWSRFCGGRHRVTDPRADPARYVADLERIATRRRYDILLPGSDATLLAIAGHGERLRSIVQIGLPAAHVIERALSKAALMESARSIGFAVPPTVICRDPSEAVAAARIFGYPVVLKPRSSVFKYGSRLRQCASATTPDEAALIHRLTEFGMPCLMQQRENDWVVSVGGVVADGQLLGAVASRYARIWHPDAGSASFSETIPLRPALIRMASELVRHLEWQGIFELELLERPDGELLPIDFNPRVYGSLSLADKAGVPLATIWCDWLRGMSAPPRFASSGFRYRREDADLLNLKWLLRRGEARAALEVARPRRRTVHAHFWLSDPLPGLAQAGLMTRYRWKRLTPGGREAAPPLDTSPAAQPVPRPPRSRIPSRTRYMPNVAVIGAGPYGLAAASFCRAEGTAVQCFGRPMESWTTAMPQGMILRSRWRSSHIASPGDALSLDRFERVFDRTLSDHIAIADFVEYGRWYQAEAVPDADRRLVRQVERDGEGFRVTLADGETTEADSVIVAAGLGRFPYRPQPFSGLPSHLVTHTADHHDLSVFREKRVLVVGAGQSALESAALLHESGARVEVLARADALEFLAPEEIGGLVRRTNAAMAPPTDVGGRMTGWAAATPDLYRRLPATPRAAIMRKVLRPRGADWLRSRLEGIPITLGRRAVRAVAEADWISIRLDDGSERQVDHVLLGTGYQVNVASYEFLADELVSGLEIRDGSPVLGRGMQSSVPGLHFVGAPATHSFGPIMRFVVGTWYAAPTVAAAVAAARPRPMRLAYRPRRLSGARRRPRPPLPPAGSNGGRVVRRPRTAAVAGLRLPSWGARADASRSTKEPSPTSRRRH